MSSSKENEGQNSITSSSLVDLHREAISKVKLLARNLPQRNTSLMLHRSSNDGEKRKNNDNSMKLRSLREEVSRLKEYKSFLLAEIQREELTATSAAASASEAPSSTTIRSGGNGKGKGKSTDWANHDESTVEHDLLLSSHCRKRRKIITDEVHDQELQSSATSTPVLSLLSMEARPYIHPFDGGWENSCFGTSSTITSNHEEASSHQQSNDDTRSNDKNETNDTSELLAKCRKIRKYFAAHRLSGISCIYLQHENCLGAKLDICTVKTGQFVDSQYVFFELVKIATSSSSSSSKNKSTNNDTTKKAKTSIVEERSDVGVNKNKDNRPLKSTNKISEILKAKKISAINDLDKNSTNKDKSSENYTSTSNKKSNKKSSANLTENTTQPQQNKYEKGTGNQDKTIIFTDYYTVRLVQHTLPLAIDVKAIVQNHFSSETVKQSSRPSSSSSSSSSNNFNKWKHKGKVMDSLRNCLRDLYGATYCYIARSTQFNSLKELPHYYHSNDNVNKHDNDSLNEQNQVHYFHLKGLVHNESYENIQFEMVSSSSPACIEIMNDEKSYNISVKVDLTYQNQLSCAPTTLKLTWTNKHGVAQEKEGVNGDDNSLYCYDFDYKASERVLLHEEGKDTFISTQYKISDDNEINKTTGTTTVELKLKQMSEIFQTNLITDAIELCKDILLSI